MSLLTESREWPETGRPRRAGVSSFGVSGTNAHVILEAVEHTDAPAHSTPAVGGGATPWVLSAASEDALRATAERLRTHLQSVTDADQDLLSVAGALLRSRARLEHRAVVVGHDREELLAGLYAVAAGEPGVVSGVAGAGAGARPVFVFPGQGAQWSRMGLELADAFPVFDDALRECAAALAIGPGRCGAARVLGRDGLPGPALGVVRCFPGCGGGSFAG
uniref:ketoacyl-synthetase C-terminal extension domain-containing protein n=1 Tax=Streptomyces griseus TaxID=1911 RepID=UPI000B0EEB79